MLAKIEIRAFKSLEKVDINPGLINVFIGANGSGKSNLLEAIGVLGAAASGRVDDEALLRRGVRPGLPALYKSSFKGSRQPSEIRFLAALENDAAEYSVGLFNPQDNPEPAWRFKTENLKQNNCTIVGRSPANKIRLDPSAGYTALKAVELPDSPASQLLDELRNFAIYSPDTSTLRGLIADSQSREPVGLSGGRLAEAVRELFTRDLSLTQREQMGRKLVKLIGWAKSMGASLPSAVPISRNIPQPNFVLRFRDKFMADGRNYLSGYDASEGALYVLFMAVLFHHSKSPKILAVDNFDHALNPRLAKALTRNICDWAIASNRQAFLTSHNPLVLDGLPLTNKSIRLFTVERSNRGKTVVTRVDVSEELMEQAARGVPLSQQWVNGVFGGIPTDM